MRLSGRSRNELRDITLTRRYTKHAEGSVLVQYGDTHVLCNASITPGVPRFLKGAGQGWITAEYGMLPRATSDRTMREATQGKQGGRTLEIQRLIGRSLRSAVDLKLLGENTITLDCDVIQADGGTRTASITGACVALVDALSVMQQRKMVKQNPLKYLIASVSVGVYKEMPILDLDYKEDSNAETDMNVVMSQQGKFIEVQGTAEGAPFEETHFYGMLELAKTGIQELIRKQKQVLDLE